MNAGNEPGTPGEPPEPGYGSPLPSYGQPYGGGQPQEGQPYQPYGQPYGGPPYGQPYGGPPAGQPPRTYLAWGIIAAIGGVLFCLIGGGSGIASIVFARRVRSRWEAGDQQGAMRASSNARTWAIVATVLDVLGLIIVIFFIARGAGGAASGTG